MSWSVGPNAKIENVKDFGNNTSNTNSNNNSNNTSNSNNTKNSNNSTNSNNSNANNSTATSNTTTSNTVNNNAPLLSSNIHKVSKSSKYTTMVPKFYQKFGFKGSQPTPAAAATETAEGEGAKGRIVGVAAGKHTFGKSKQLVARGTSVKSLAHTATATANTVDSSNSKGTSSGSSGLGYSDQSGDLSLVSGSNSRIEHLNNVLKKGRIRDRSMSDKQQGAMLRDKLTDEMNKMNATKGNEELSTSSNGSSWNDSSSGNKSDKIAKSGQSGLNSKDMIGESGQPLKKFNNNSISDTVTNNNRNIIDTSMTGMNGSNVTVKSDKNGKHSKSELQRVTKNRRKNSMSGKTDKYGGNAKKAEMYEAQVRAKQHQRTYCNMDNINDADGNKFIGRFGNFDAKAFGEFEESVANNSFNSSNSNDCNVVKDVDRAYRKSRQKRREKNEKEYKQEQKEFQRMKNKNNKNVQNSSDVDETGQNSKKRHRKQVSLTLSESLSKLSMTPSNSKDMNSNNIGSSMNSMSGESGEGGEGGEGDSNELGTFSDTNNGMNSVSDAFDDSSNLNNFNSLSNGGCGVNGGVSSIAGVNDQIGESGAIEGDLDTVMVDEGCIGNNRKSTKTKPQID